MITLLLPYDLGTIENIKGLKVKITKESWAPGIWAGTEGLGIEYSWEGKNSKAIVTKVDLDNRVITIKEVK